MSRYCFAICKTDGALTCKLLQNLEHFFGWTAHGALKVLFTSNIRFLSYDFDTAVNRSKIADKIAVKDARQHYDDRIVDVRAVLCPFEEG